MPNGHPRDFELTLSDTERAPLNALAASRTLPHSVVCQAQIILRSAEGKTHTAIAARVGLTVQSVGHWRRRFHRDGLAGLSNAPRSGRPRTHDDDRVATLLHTVLASTPTAGTHWRGRAAANQTGTSKSTVQRNFALYGIGTRSPRLSRAHRRERPRGARRAPGAR